MQTYEQLSQLENKLVEAQYEYDELNIKYNAVRLFNERTSLKNEDYRSILMNYELKFKELKEWEKKLKMKEKELRSIKKRDNPFEYVDYSDKHIQTCNPIKNKGVNTDAVTFESPYKSQKSQESQKPYLKSSFADTVTTCLGGIAIQTDGLSDREIITPKDHLRSMRPINPISLKNRPQSSQVVGTTYSYNIKTGIIEEEEDPLGMTTLSNHPRDMFRTTSTIQMNNFHSPSNIKPTALQRHHQIYKTKQNKIKKNGYDNITKHRAKTAMSMNKRERRNIHASNLKNIYIKKSQNERPITEQGKV